MCSICACTYVATQLLLVSLLFIAIPTPLFKFKFLNNLVCLLFISVVLVRPCNFSFSYIYSKLDKTF